MQVSSIGPQGGASQTVGGSTLPSSPQPRSIFTKTSGGSEGFYVCSSAGVWTGPLGTGGSSSIEIGVTPITSGTAGRVLFEGAGNVVSENANFTFNGTQSGIGAPIDSPPLWPVNTFDNGMTVGYAKTSAFTTDYVEGLSVGLSLDLPSNAPAGYVHTLEVAGEIKSGNNKNLYRLFGAFLAAQHKGTGTVSQFVGVFGLANNLSTGTTTYAVGGEFAVGNSFGGTIPDAYGVYIEPAANGGGGVITRNYGIYLDAQTAGVNNWNLYSAGATSKNTFEGPVEAGSTITQTGNGALSAPAISGVGTWITGGSATTTKPYVLIEPTGTTSTAWSTSGTGLGVNAPNGFTGKLLDLQVNGASKVSADSSGITSTVRLVASELVQAGSGFQATSFGAFYGINGGSRMEANNGNLTFTDPIILKGFTVATLPAGTLGMAAHVTDGDAGLAWGATVVNTGAGATKYLVWYSGTNWTVVGK